MSEKEYIERGALLDKLKELKEEWGFTFTADGVEEAMFAVEEEPAADVVEVRHGEWVQQLRPYDDEIMCSVCGAIYNIIDNCTEKFDYCPTCGAKMGGERKEQT